MTSVPFPWLPPPSDDAEAGDDPWADVEVPEVALTTEQEGFLAAFAADQPAPVRVRDVGDPFTAFEDT